jgi:hypothetical protein
MPNGQNKVKEVRDPEAESKAQAEADVAAAQAEVAGEGWTVEFGGVEYRVDKEATESIEFIEALGIGNDALMVRALLGPTQWNQFKQRHRPASALVEFTEALGKEMGSGNS